MMIHNHIIYTPFSDWRFEIAGAVGSYIFEKGGRKILDFTSGWNVVNAGWNNPEIVEAACSQLRQNTYAPMWCEDPVQAAYAELLTGVLPKKLNSVSRTTGGMEANEEAIKAARTSTGRKKILGFIKSYHGASINCLALSYLPEWSAPFTDPRPDLVQTPFPKLSDKNVTPAELLARCETQLEEKLSKNDVAAVLTESGTITGWGSTDVAPDGFLTLVRRLTAKYGTLLILDEVGSGFSRLGKLFALEIEKVTPDIMTLAKGISNGVSPIGVMVTTKKVAEKSGPANLQSTFGWMPVPCAAAKKTLEIHLRDRLWEKAARDGKYMREVLERELKNNPHVKEIRGRGMEIGIDFDDCQKGQNKNAGLVDTIITQAWEKGLHLVSDHESVIQLMPTLTIERADLDKGLTILIDLIKEI